MSGERAIPSSEPISSPYHSIEFTDAIHILNQFECNFSTVAVQFSPNVATSFSSHPNLAFRITRYGAADFTLSWDVTRETGLIARSALSAADLYWIDPETKLSTRIAHTIGQTIHREWPSALCGSLCITINQHDVDKIKLPIGKPLDWSKPHSFLARLSFYPITMVNKAPAPAPAVPIAGSLLAARNFSSHHLKAEPHDVKFVFKRGGEESCLWTSADVLRENCPYFETLFNFDFVEARYFSDKDRSKKRKLENSVTTTEESIGGELDDNDSDVDIDDHLIETFTSNAIPSPSSTLLYYQISIRNASYSTYRVVLMYLQTGHVWLAPLTSSFSHLPVEARSKARLEAISAQQKLEPHLPPPASPKSIYKLAHYLSLPALQSLALAEISRQLSIENVFIELFDGLASVFDEVRRVMVAFAVKHKKEVVETEGFKGVMENLRRNELEFSGPVMADLLPLLVG